MRSLLALACAVLLGGCGLQLSDVALHPSPRRPSRQPAAETATSAPVVTGNEVPTAPGPMESASGAHSPVAALSGFAARYINWNAADVAADLRELAHGSVGGARTAMQLAAAQIASDPEIAQDGIANSGTVEAVTPLRGGGRYAIVTRERTTATATSAYDGLAPSWHLTLASVRREPDGSWVVSGWQPQS
jgi:hypothetical protein